MVYSLRDKLDHYRSIAWGMSEYLQKPPQSDPKSLIRQNLDNRHKVWLDTLRRTVFASANNPYRRLFELAHCSFEDVCAAVYDKGVEPALERLRSAGVHLTHDEFKGKTPIFRHGKEIPAPPGAFVSPFAAGWLQGRTSGSRSAGSATLTGTAHLDYLTGYAALNVEEFKIDRGSYVIVRPILPSIAGLYFCLFHSRLGCNMGPWFVHGGSGADSLHYRTLSYYIVALARLRGYRAPWPRFLPQNDFTPVAGWIAEERRRGRPCFLQAVASVGARVAAAARENNLDVRGTVFLSGGEPLTPGKRKACEAAGMEVYPSYWVSEIGQIGHACSSIREGNCVHLFEDSVAVINHPRPAPFSGCEIHSLLFTSLLPHSPHVLINCDMDDAGVIENFPCHCVFGKLGFNKRIRDITSCGKLTGLGMTLVGSDVLRILEEDLPARFGGSPADYQLVQRDGEGQTELILRISPRLHANPTDAKAFFLGRLKSCYGGALAARVWKHADALHIVLDEPLQTSAGKTLPLHIATPR